MTTRVGGISRGAALGLDGVVRVERDGERLAEYGPRAMLGERSALEDGTRTSTSTAVTPCRIAVADASVFERAGGCAPTLILDAGTGVRNVTALRGEVPFTGTLLLSHLHWDHAHRLPFFRAGDRDGASTVAAEGAALDL